jgi:hypothetical protein
MENLQNRVKPDICWQDSPKSESGKRFRNSIPALFSVTGHHVLRLPFFDKIDWHISVAAMFWLENECDLLLCPKRSIS